MEKQANAIVAAEKAMRKRHEEQLSVELLKQNGDIVQVAKSIKRQRDEMEAIVATWRVETKRHIALKDEAERVLQQMDRIAKRYVRKAAGEDDDEEEGGTVSEPASSSSSSDAEEEDEEEEEEEDEEESSASESAKKKRRVEGSPAMRKTLVKVGNKTKLERIAKLIHEFKTFDVTTAGLPHALYALAAVRICQRATGQTGPVSSYYPKLHECFNKHLRMGYGLPRFRDEVRRVGYSAFKRAVHKGLIEKVPSDQPGDHYQPTAKGLEFDKYLMPVIEEMLIPADGKAEAPQQ